MTQRANKVFTKPTIDDVARHANVSKSAVSHFINGRVHICSAETGSVTDEFDYRLLHFPLTIRNGDQCDAFLDGSIDGLLMSAGRHDRRFEIMARAGLPTVATSRWTGLPDEVGSVWSDDAHAIDLAMDHLWSLGHRRIAHIAAGMVSAISIGGAAPTLSDAAVTRAERYRAWLAEHDASTSALVISGPGWGVLPAEDAIKALDIIRSPENSATAVICANDAIAYGIILAAKNLGIRIPQQLSVVGIDNNGNCIAISPPLTTVELPFWEIGRQSGLLLHRLMCGDAATGRRILIPVVKLVERGSTAEVLE